MLEELKIYLLNAIYIWFFYFLLLIQSVMHNLSYQMDRVKRIWYLSPMRAAKVQASLRIRAVSPEPSLLAHTSSESRGTFRQKARSLAPLNGWACAVKICQNRMLKDTNSLDGDQIMCSYNIYVSPTVCFHIHIWAWMWQDKMACVPSEDSDQPWHTPSLIRVFTVHLMCS